MGDDVRETIGRNVRAVMVLRGVSQDTVAEHLGFGQSQVSRRLLGQIDFNATELLALAELLNVPVQHFLQIEDPSIHVPAPRGAGERHPHGAPPAAAPDAPPNSAGGDGSPTRNPRAGEPTTAADMPASESADARGEGASTSRPTAAAAAGTRPPLGRTAGGPGHPTETPARRDPEASTAPGASAVAAPGGPDPNEKRAADATATR